MGAGKSLNGREKNSGEEKSRTRIRAPGDKGRDPFNQNFRAEVRKFLGVEWIATSPNGLVSFHSQNEVRAHLKWRMLDHCCSYYQ